MTTRTLEDLHGTLRGCGLSGDRAREILALGRRGTTLDLRAGGAVAEEEVGLGATKVGGFPDLPEGAAWPRGEGRGGPLPPGVPPRRGRPLSFLAQVNLAEVATVSPTDFLPREGILHFFYDALGQPWGYDPADRGAWRVLLSPVGPLSRRKPPEDLAPEGRFSGRGAAVVERFDLPEPGSEVILPLGLSGAEADAYADFFYADRADREEAGPRHRLLGLPDPVHPDHMRFQVQMVSSGVYMGGSGGPAPTPELVADLAPGAERWHLLLQLDSDAEAGMEWGDVGRLYFWAAPDALDPWGFERTWVVLESH